MSNLNSKNEGIEREFAVLMGLGVLVLFVALGFYFGRSSSAVVAPPAQPQAVAAPVAAAPQAVVAAAPVAAQAPAPAPQVVAAEPPPTPAPPTPAVAPPTPRPTPPAPAPQPAAAAPANEPIPPDQVWRVKVNPEDAVKGPADAPLTAVMFTAFGCGTCTTFAPAIDQAFQKYGKKLRVVFKHKVIPPSPFAIEASMAALAAKEQGKFWEYQDKLWATNEALTQSTLERIATEVGLDMARFRKDAQADRFRGQILKDSLLANEVGAHSMPNVMVNGVRMSGEKSWESLDATLDDRLKVAEDLIKKGTKPADLYASIVKTGKYFPQLEEAKFQFANDQSPSIGPKDAKVQITTFEDFQCPFCSKVGEPLKAFQKQFPNDVRLVFKNFPLASIHDKAQLASEAALAAFEQGKFWEYHDVLFANQQSLDRPDLERYAEQVGLDMTKFRAALDSGKFKSFIQAEMDDGARSRWAST